MSTTTLPADTIDIRGVQAWTAVGFFENLMAVRLFSGTGPNVPYMIDNTGLLQDTGSFLSSPKAGRIANLLTKRDLTSGSEATMKKMVFRDDIGVRCSMKLGPVSIAQSAIDRNKLNYGFLEQTVGQQFADAVGLDLRNKLVGITDALAAAMTSTLHDNSIYVASGTKATFEAKQIQKTLSKIGDRSDYLRGYGGIILNSDCFYDLFASQVGTLVANVAGEVLNTGRIASQGMNYAQCDADSLKLANGSNYVYNKVLMVGPNVLDIQFTGVQIYDPFFDVKLENPSWVIQGNVEMMITAPGFKWNVSAGGENPDNTALFTSSNWTPTYSSHKEVNIVRCICNSSND